MADETTYLELSEDGDGAHKFYEVTVAGTAITIRYGRIGDSGQRKTQSFPTEEAARKEATKKLNEKRRKGYAPAVRGERKKRAITRRESISHVSTAKQAPVLWRFQTHERAFGIFVNSEKVWIGNEIGSVYALDHTGKLLEQVRLPDGVKCIVSDQDWLYAGADDGCVYDLTGKVPRVAYRISDDVDIFWLDIRDAVLSVSDASGMVVTFNHEEHTQWKRRGFGTSGWMVRCDEVGVYHGHSKGVTMYDWEDGAELWQLALSGAVLFGWQEESALYVATNANKVHRVTKKGALTTTYDCDAVVYSCASTDDGQYLFAADNSSSIYCFASSGERLWKLGTGCGSALSMQTYGDKLYIVTTSGDLACIDASPAAIEAAKSGQIPKVETRAAPAPVAAADTRQVSVAQSVGAGVELLCYRENDALHVRVVSPGYEESWRVQFPKEIREEGARYVVDAVRPAQRGHFYRTVGEIKRLSL